MADVAEVKHDPKNGVIVGVGRTDLLERIGELWRGDWTGQVFDGRDGRRWINTAVYGDADDLRALDQELARLEADDG